MAPWWLPALGFVSAEGLQVNGLSCSQAEQERGLFLLPLALEDLGLGPSPS